MNSGLSPGDPVLIAAFRSALLHQGVIALVMVVLLGLVGATARVWPASTPAGDEAVSDGAVAAGNPEPRGRWLLRTGFGVLWIVDGLLQAQPKMAGGLATQVIGPAAASSPAWVQHLVNWGGTIWSYHRSRRPRPACGSRSASAPGSSPRAGAPGPGCRGRPAWPGA
ncbi:MAG TPA: hypothetical protein VFQ68_04320 [Streptosporangiaceae bacterium]|nr:hypothetical protein [Streptosporangiaceae bacterium]